MISQRLHLWHGVLATLFAVGLALYRGVALTDRARPVDLLTLFACGFLAGASCFGILARLRATPHSAAP